jgi:phosphatidylserine/phosphatidylglycerophosphate/cardiolipin synthase-like enzyme
MLPINAKPRNSALALALIAALVAFSLPAPGRTAPIAVPGPVRIAFSPRGDAQEVILRELRGAKERVDLAMFYLSDDTLIDALCYLAAKKKVRIRVFVDEEMARASHRPKLDRLARHGAEVYVEALPRKGKLHLKTLVVDGKTVVTGSANWTMSAFKKNCEDTVVFESTQLAERYLGKFEELKSFAALHEPKTGEVDDVPKSFPQADSAARNRKDERPVAPRVQTFRDVRSLESFITPGREGVERLLQRAGEAQQGVDVGIYYLSDRAVVDRLEEIARKKRVQVRVLADDTMLAGKRLNTLQRLHEAGAAVYYMDEDRASLHLKNAVIDGRFVVTGSHNWTPSAAERNVEDMLVIESRDAASHYTKYLDYLIEKHAKPYADIGLDAVTDTADAGKAPRSTGASGPRGKNSLLPKTGPRRSFEDMFQANSLASLELQGHVLYISDGEYLPLLRRLVKAANQSIMVSMYHLAPGSRTPEIDALLDLLADAAKRGVYVYVVLNSPENMSDSQHAAHSGAAEFLRDRAVDARLGVPGVNLHEKLVVVDLSKILLGSHNWSEGALNGEGVYESSAFIVLQRQEPRFANYIMQHPAVRDMTTRDAWENELSLLRHLGGMAPDERRKYIQSIPRGVSP